MKIFCINPVNPEPQRIKMAARFVAEGAPVVLPTDTVYGIGVIAAAGHSPQPLFDLKGRDADKAIPLLVDGIAALEQYGSTVPAYAFDLASRYWPGALTLIVHASAAVPDSFLAADKSVALRAPASPVVLALLRELGAPLATTSANLQGGEPATSLETLDPRLAAQVVFAIDGGPTLGNTPSTIISCLTDTPILVRAGMLPIDPTSLSLRATRGA
jgi:L-threonylcarbamoyladenylate synthase